MPTPSHFGHFRCGAHPARLEGKLGQNGAEIEIDDRGHGYLPDGQIRVFEAGMLFARTEGIVPAPESAHAIAAVITEAEQAREAGKKRVILFNLSGHGLLDLSAYETYLQGKIQDV